MSDLKNSLRAFEASLKQADIKDLQLEIEDAIEGGNGKKLKALLNKGEGATAAKALLTAMKYRTLKLPDVLKLL